MVSCCRDISQINNSVEYSEAEYEDTIGCLTHDNREIMQVKFVFFKRAILHYSR